MGCGSVAPIEITAKPVEMLGFSSISLLLVFPKRSEISGIWVVKSKRVGEGSCFFFFVFFLSSFFFFFFFSVVFILFPLHGRRAIVRQIKGKDRFLLV